MEVKDEKKPPVIKYKRRYIPDAVKQIINTKLKSREERQQYIDKIRELYR